MRFSLVASFAGLALASPSPVEPAPDVSNLVNSVGEKNLTELVMAAEASENGVSELVKATGGTNLTAVSDDEFHEQVLLSMKDVHVINSDDLYDYFSNNTGASHTIYVNDTREFIQMSSVEKRMDKRQYSSPCYGSTRYFTQQVQQWWSEWSPASSCLYTGHSPVGATYTLGWAYSRALTTNAKIDFTIIKDVLSFSSGVDLTETWTNSGSIACMIPGRSVGQIFLQNRLVWGWMWSRNCQACGSSGTRCDAGRPEGGALAPARSTGSGSANYGCTSGFDRVRCN